MKSHCPVCAGPELEPTVANPPRLFCENFEPGFPAADALVSFATLLDLAEGLSACTCDDAHGAPRCFRRAEEMIGATVRDSRGRTWKVTDVDQKDGLPTIVGDAYRDRPGEVEILTPASAQPQPAGQGPIRRRGANCRRRALR